jgi:predicted nucleic acid-binding protein
MDIFFDTSVLVAASVRSHPHHAQALPALQRVIAGKDRGVFSNHSIAEVFSALTRIPVVPRIHPAEAARIVQENILSHFEGIAIGKSDYVEVMKTMATGGWVGGKIYDALLLWSAQKANVDRVYTLNLKDFRLLAPPSLQAKICAPQ